MVAFPSNHICWRFGAETSVMMSLLSTIPIGGEAQGGGIITATQMHLQQPSFDGKLSLHVFI